MAFCPNCSQEVEKTRIKSDPITLQEYYYEWYCKNCDLYYPILLIKND